MGVTETILQPFTYCCEREVSPNQKICLYYIKVGLSYDIHYNKFRAKPCGMTRKMYGNLLLVNQPTLVEEDSVVALGVGAKHLDENVRLGVATKGVHVFHIRLANDDNLTAIESATLNVGVQVLDIRVVTNLVPAANEGMGFLRLFLWLGEEGREYDGVKKGVCNKQRKDERKVFVHK